MTGNSEMTSLQLFLSSNKIFIPRYIYETSLLLHLEKQSFLQTSSNLYTRTATAVFFVLCEIFALVSSIESEEIENIQTWENLNFLRSNNLDWAKSIDGKWIILTRPDQSVWEARKSREIALARLEFFHSLPPFVFVTMVYRADEREGKDVRNRANKIPSCIIPLQTAQFRPQFRMWATRRTANGLKGSVRDYLGSGGEFMRLRKTVLLPYRSPRKS